jgi:hypothetical protein
MVMGYGWRKFDAFVKRNARVGVDVAAIFFWWKIDNVSAFITARVLENFSTFLALNDESMARLISTIEHIIAFFSAVIAVRNYFISHLLHLFPVFHQQRDFLQKFSTESLPVFH